MCVCVNASITVGSFSVYGTSTIGIGTALEQKSTLKLIVDRSKILVRELAVSSTTAGVSSFQ